MSIRGIRLIRLRMGIIAEPCECVIEASGSILELAICISTSDSTELLCNLRHGVLLNFFNSAEGVKSILINLTHKARNKGCVRGMQSRSIQTILSKISLNPPLCHFLFKYPDYTVLFAQEMPIIETKLYERGGKTTASQHKYLSLLYKYIRIYLQTYLHT